MLTITERAAQMMKLALEQEGKSEYGLRLLAQAGGGCSCSGGVAYGLFPEPEAGPSDAVITESGVRIYVDPASLTLLKGTTIDYVEHPEHRQGFTIETPNVQSEGCGCGDQAHGGDHGCSYGGECNCS